MTGFIIFTVFLFSDDIIIMWDLYNSCNFQDKNKSTSKGAGENIIAIPVYISSYTYYFPNNKHLQESCVLFLTGRYVVILLQKQ